MTNTRMAAILGMDTDGMDDEPRGEVVVVEPHEITTIDNDDLPSMYDIDRRQLQAEKQLDEIIDTTMQYQRELFKTVADTEAKYKARVTEVANATLGIALDAIKTKLKTQVDKKKQRMEEASFTRPNKGSGVGAATTNVFIGTREDFMNAILPDTPDVIDAEVEDKN